MNLLHKLFNQEVAPSHFLPSNGINANGVAEGFHEKGLEYYIKFNQDAVFGKQNAEDFKRAKNGIINSSVFRAYFHVIGDDRIYIVYLLAGNEKSIYCIVRNEHIEAIFFEYLPDNLCKIELIL